MELELRVPLDTLIAKLDWRLEAIDRKLDALALAAAAPGPASQPEPATPAAPARRGRTPKAPPAPATDRNGEDTNVEDEDALRARVEFEAKRTTRQFGIGGTRAAISRVTDGALRVDDVPTSCLTAVLSALQAL